MAKVTVDAEDGSAPVEYHDQAYTDAAVAAAVAAVPPVPTVAPTETEIDVLLSDGTTKKFVPAQ